MNVHVPGRSMRQVGQSDRSSATDKARIHSQWSDGSCAAASDLCAAAIRTLCKLESASSTQAQFSSLSACRCEVLPPNASCGLKYQSQGFTHADSMPVSQEIIAIPACIRVTSMPSAQSFSNCPISLRDIEQRPCVPALAHRLSGRQWWYTAVYPATPFDLSHVSLSF